MVLAFVPSVCLYCNCGFCLCCFRVVFPSQQITSSLQTIYNIASRLKTFVEGSGCNQFTMLKYTTFRAMLNLHAGPAFSSSSETETANLRLAQNCTW